MFTVKCIDMEETVVQSTFGLNCVSAPLILDGGVVHVRKLLKMLFFLKYV